MSALKNHDRPSGTADTAPTKKSRKRRAGGLVAVAAVFAVLLSAVAVPAAQAHEPEAKTVCPDGYTLSGDETECAKTTVADHGEAECGAGYSLVAKTRGAAVCEKEVGEPTCDEGKGDDCVISTDLGPPKHCASGSLKSGRCVTDHGSPTCAKGNLKNGVCIGPADLGPPVCATGSLENNRCVSTTDHGKPAVCAKGNLKNGVCIGSADFGPPKKCATGRYFWGGCIGEVESIASYRCTSGALASGAFGVPVCRHTASKRCPAGYKPLWGGCYHPVTYKTTLPSCPSGYSSSGSRCVKYTSVSWYCTAGQGAFKSPNKCVTTKVVGSPTCAAGSLKNGKCVGTADLGPPTQCAAGSLKGGRCVGTADLGPPTQCAAGSLKGGRCVGTADLGPPKHCATGGPKSGRCVTDHGPPTCAAGSPKNGVCIGTAGRGALKCATGQPQGSKCVDRKTPDCQNGSLQGTRCVTRTTDTTAPTNTLNHHVAHDCPTSHSYTPPLPELLWIHINTGEVIDYSAYQNLDSVSRAYYEHPAWERVDDTHDCHKPVLKNAAKIGVFTRIEDVHKKIADGAAAAGETLGNVAVAVGDRTVDIATYCFNNDCMTYVTGEEMREGIEAGAKAAWDGLKTAARWALCRNRHITYPVTATMGLALGAFAGKGVLVTATALGITVSHPVLWLGAAAVLASVGLSYAHYELCKALADDSDSQSVSVPGPASGLALVAGDGQISVSWSASADTPAAGFGYRVVWKTRAQSWGQAVAASQFEDLEHGDDLATSYAITGLSNGSAYKVRVAAFNDGGFSKWVTATATPAGAVPGPPSRLELAAGDGQISVSWSASADTPAAGFGYRVVWKTRAQSWAKAAAASQFEDLEHGDDLATSYAITGLSNGSAYKVRVAAFNDGGFSKWIDATATPTAPPEGLSDVEVARTFTNSNSGQTHARVVWKWTGDNPLGFQLRAERSGAEAVSLNEGQETQVTWLDLPKGGTGDYTIKVRAIFSYIDDDYGPWVEITHKAE